MMKRIMKTLVVITFVVSLLLSTSVLAHAIGADFGVDTEEILARTKNIFEELKTEHIEIEFVKNTHKTKTTEINFVETKSVETEAIATESAKAETTATEPIETEVVETEPTIVEMVPQETEPAETESTIVENAPQETENIVVETIDPDADPMKIVQIDEYEDGTKIFRFKKGDYTIPYLPENDGPRVTESGYVEQISEVPHYLQQSYPDTMYGTEGTVSSHGCGITSVAMVFSYLLDRKILPDQLAEEYGRYNTPVGSDYALFGASAADYGLEVKQVYDWQSVEEALKNGGVVIANRRKDLFTKGGHYIVYYGITEDGKVLVKDPNIYNYGQWSNPVLKEGFANGFELKSVRYSFPCWIYAPKDLDAIAAQVDAEALA